MSEKGRCDVCAAPCSSCMHFDHPMEFSGDTSVLSTATTTAKDDTDESDIDVSTISLSSATLPMGLDMTRVFCRSKCAISAATPGGRICSPSAADAATAPSTRQLSLSFCITLKLKLIIVIE